MFGDQPIVIDESPWFDRHEESPAPLVDRFGMDVIFAAARRNDQPTVALLGAFRFPGRYADIYGARVANAIHVLALKPETGQVWTAACEHGHGVPLSAAMNPDPPPPPPGFARRSATAGHFNVDLAGHLGLPPDKATYAVFAWADEYVTAVELVDVPRNPSRQGMTEPIGRARVKVAHFEEGRDTPKANDDGTPALAWKPVIDDRGEQRLMVLGAIGPGAFADRKDDDPPPQLSLVALSHWQRELRWVNAPLPPEALAAKRAAFRFDLFHLLNRPEKPQAFFILAAVGQLRSPVLTIPASASETK